MKNKEKHIDFYPNGQNEEEGTFVNGKKDGIWKEWWDNGIQMREIKWKLGVRNGVCIWWDKEGKKTTQGRYLNNLKNGEWNTYLDGKKIILKEYFVDDRVEGEL